MSTTLCEISINYQHKTKLSELPVIHTSKDAYEQFKSVWSNRLQHIEEMYLMLLNRGNKVLGYSKISGGGISGTMADVRVIFQVALKSNACSIILCHNHPSGNLKPSEADIKITKGIRDAGKMMEIPLLDHLIITDESYYSLADEGII